MPRRPAKSKAASKSKARPVSRDEAKIKRWDKLSDIPMDEEDQCTLFGEDFSGDDDGDEEEVFGLKGLSEGDSADDGEDQDDMDMDEEPAPGIKSKKSKAKKLASKDSSDSSESESEEETWGHNKSAYYSSNAAQLESDDEEANELEEQEAKRLQAKARDVMGEDDFGLGDPLEDVEGRADIE